MKYLSYLADIVGGKIGADIMGGKIGSGAPSSQSPWCFTKGANRCICWWGLSATDMSFHYAIFGQIAISKPAPAKRVVTSRNLRAIDRDQLKADLSTLSLSMDNLTVDSLIDTHNDTPTDTRSAYPVDHLQYYGSTIRPLAHHRSQECAT